jgi:hypothetical protein
MKSRRMSWAGHVALMGEERNVYKVLVGKPKGKDQSGDRGVDRRMGLECILGILAGEWIELAYDSERWRDLVNAVIKFPVLAPRK